MRNFYSKKKTQVFLSNKKKWKARGERSGKILKNHLHPPKSFFFRKPQKGKKRDHKQLFVFYE